MGNFKTIFCKAKEKDTSTYTSAPVVNILKTVPKVVKVRPKPVPIGAPVLMEALLTASPSLRIFYKSIKENQTLALS